MDYTLTADYGASALTGENAGAQAAAILTDGPVLSTSIALWLPLSLADGVTLGATSAQAYALGAAIAEAVNLNATPATQLVWAQLLSDRTAIAQALQAATTLSLSETTHLTDATATALAIAVAQTLFVKGQPTSLLAFNLSVAEAMTANAAFAAFLGANLHETATLTSSPTPLWLAGAAVSETLTLASTAGASLMLCVTCADGSNFDDAEALQAILAGTVAEDVEITAGYVAPSGNFTAWAINTRTTAVTEYRNFAFDSFAQIGLKCVAGNASGLYELDGDSDAGAPVLADLLSGLMQVGGSRLAAFKCAYLGLGSKGGQFVLKLITGDNQTYIYGLTARDMRTTRVNFGKGLRSRYFRFELQNIDGADFDMNNIEFVPLVAQRRI